MQSAGETMQSTLAQAESSSQEKGQDLLEGIAELLIISISGCAPAKEK
jgi:hypothetical protein